MVQGTTPRHIIQTDVDLSDFPTRELTIKQGSTTITKTAADMLMVDEKHLLFSLTENETLSLEPGTPITWQLRLQSSNGYITASIPQYFDIYTLLQGGSMR